MINWIDLKCISTCLCVFCCTMLTLNIEAQDEFKSPYSLNWKREAALLGGGIATATTSIIIGFEMEELSSDAIANADRNDIWAFDRGATRYWSPSAGRASDWGRNIAYSLPFVLLFDKKLRRDFWSTAFIGTEALLLTSGITGLTKVTARRVRPFVYNPDAPFEEKETRSARLSFFSGHTSVTSVLCFVSAKMYLDHHPDSPLKTVIWTTAATIPAVTGYFRYRAGKHFPTDVIAGYLFGAGVGILIPELHKKKDPDTGFYLEPRGGFGSNGVALGWRF